MTEKNREEKNRQRSIRPLAILLGILLLGGVSYMGYSLLAPRTNSFAPGPVPVSEGQAGSEQPAPITPLSGATDQETEQVVDAEEPSASDKAADECEKTVVALTALFDRLDRSSYIKEFQLKQGTAHHCNLLARKLFANPPNIVRETDNLFSILNNMTHFYRILGKWNVLLLKEFLVREEENLEEIMALFYHWSEISPRCESTGAADTPLIPEIIDLPLAGLYEYAGFFLNTMGGQAYLFRRQSKIRLLVKYYAILILDRANDQEINLHGLDIRPSLDSLIREMESFPELGARESYLQQLYTLQENYQNRYGH